MSNDRGTPKDIFGLKMINQKETGAFLIRALSHCPKAQIAEVGAVAEWSMAP